MNGAIDPSARLERALRFADLAINAAAVARPADVMPSALPEEIAQSEAAAVVAPDSTHPEHAAQHELGTAPQLEASRVEQPLPIEQSLSDDALARSFQSAIDAVRDSLNQSPESGHVALPQSTGATYDGETHDTQAAEPVAAVASIAPLAAPISAGLAANDLAAVTEVSAAGAGAEIVPTVTRPANLAVAQGEFSQELLSLQDAVKDVAVAPPELPQEISSILQPVGETIGTAVDAATSTPIDLVGGSPADDGAVTVPSLVGAGVDALAGLLPPAPNAPDPSNVVDPVLTSLHEAPLLAAIGAPDITHADQELAHTTHSVLHLVGSGLI